jgi:hypothetical protein
MATWEAAPVLVRCPRCHRVWFQAVPASSTAGAWFVVADVRPYVQLAELTPLRVRVRCHPRCGLDRGERTHQPVQRVLRLDRPDLAAAR